jgi:hypothetical protein
VVARSPRLCIVFTMAAFCPRCGNPASLGTCTRCGEPLELPAIDISQLARLDEIGQPPGTQSSRPAPQSPALETAAFRPPQEVTDKPLGVERSTRAIRIENQWQREKLAKQAVAALPPPRPPRKPIGGAIAAVMIIAAVAAVVAWVVGLPTHAQPPRGDDGVSIRIIARDPIEVKIDGHSAGKTPVTLQRARGTEQVTITTANGAKQVIPDRDQVVDVSP